VRNRPGGEHDGERPVPAGALGRATPPRSGLQSESHFGAGGLLPGLPTAGLEAVAAGTLNLDLPVIVTGI